jgi:hypothetical protein
MSKNILVKFIFFYLLLYFKIFADISFETLNWHLNDHGPISFIEIKDNYIIINTSTGLYKSNDLGVNWESIILSDSIYHIYDIYFDYQNRFLYVQILVFTVLMILHKLGKSLIIILLHT